jgi:signal peptidase I
MAVYVDTGHVGGGASPVHVAMPAWESAAPRRPSGPHAPPLSPNTRAVLRATGRVAGALRWVLLVVAALIMGGVTIASLLGFRIMIVTGGSMEPTFGPGDAVVIRPGGVGSIHVGDVITFRAPGTHGMTTHRVTAVRTINGTLWFQTKGDANPTTDPNLTSAGSVYGRQKMTLSKLGRFLYFALSPLGKLALLGLPISFLAAQEIGFLMRTSRRRRQRQAPHLRVAPANGPPAPGHEEEPQPVAHDPDLLVLAEARTSGSPVDPYTRVEAELRAESARLAAAEEALVELQRKVAKLEADNRHVHVSVEYPTEDRGLELEVALPG